MKLTVPITKTFRFVTTPVDGKLTVRRLDEGEPADPDSVFYVTFRQATRVERERRASYLSKRAYTYEDGRYIQIEDINPDALTRIEVGMTLSDTDLEYPDPKTGESKRLEFVKEGWKSQVKDSREFDAFWGSITEDLVAIEIHRACVEVNPDWDTKSRYL